MDISVVEASEKWGVSLRQVQRLLVANRIPRAKKIGRSWIIPADAVKPGDAALGLLQERCRFPVKLRIMGEHPPIQVIKDRIPACVQGASFLLQEGDALGEVVPLKGGINRGKRPRAGAGRNGEQDHKTP